MDLDDRFDTLRFLIRDRDPLFTTAFGEVFKTERLQIITTLLRAPRMNAICERVIGTLRLSGTWPTYDPPAENPSSRV